MAKGSCTDESGSAVVAAGIILPIIDDLEPGHDDLELPNNIGRNGKDCAGVLTTGLENVCER